MLACHARILLSATVRCGALANIVPEALETAFEVLKANEPGMQTARLHIIHETLVLACGVCKREFTPENGSPYAPCPFCGHEFFHDLRSGRELILEQLQVSEEQEE